MDKVRVKKRIKEGFSFAYRSFLGVALGFACVFALIAAAKNESSLFYYAMAFASPGCALEYIQKPKAPAEDPPSADFSTDKIGAESPPAQPEEPAVLIPEKEIPEVPENRRGKVTETEYKLKTGGGNIALEHAVIKNTAGKSTEKISSVLKNRWTSPLSTDLSTEPSVLIYHTHATEGFEPADRGYFDLSGTWRSTDNTENMVAVGEVITSVLREKGIGVIHDTTQHDDPGYNGSYDRSRETILAQMEENPSLKIFLDIHRDAIEPSENEIIKPTTTVNGKKAAQIMIISGCDNGKFNMPNYWENLRFAAALADKLEELYPGITRPVLFDYRKYNMDLSPNLLLIEIGATGNTLEEAKYSGELLASVLAELLKTE